MKPSTTRDIDKNQKEVGLFNLQITIRKPICDYVDSSGVTRQKHSDIQIHIETDPLGKLMRDGKNQTKRYDFIREYTTLDGVEKLLLYLAIDQQTEIYDFFTSLTSDSLMYFETQIPLAELTLNGTCDGNGNQMPIDLITVEYANRVPSSQ